VATLHNLKPEKVIKTFEKAGWVNKGQRGNHGVSLFQNYC
jgi:predicted RNA binding protein YcfA (HicA-like mRNA interferase family)